MSAPRATETVPRQLVILSDEIIACRKCPRLVSYRQRVAQTKRRAFRDWTYWGGPVPGFGDPHADLLIIGLAPAAHGANRTGRVFTGDRSGEFLYRHLHRAGFANQPTSTHRNDGLKLLRTYITAAVRCAPAANRPLPSELRNCEPYLRAELELLQPRAVLALGKIAFDAYLRLLVSTGAIASRAGFHFAHGADYELPAVPAQPPHRLFASYHPSQQNTQTGRLTSEMFLSVLKRIRRFLDQ